MKEIKIIFTQEEMSSIIELIESQFTDDSSAKKLSEFSSWELNNCIYFMWFLRLSITGVLGAIMTEVYHTLRFPYLGGKPGSRKSKKFMKKWDQVVQDENINSEYKDVFDSYIQWIGNELSNCIVQGLLPVEYLKNDESLFLFIRDYVNSYAENKENNDISTVLKKSVEDSKNDDEENEIVPKSIPNNFDFEKDRNIISPF